MSKDDKDWVKMKSLGTFDEANYYQGNSFQIGGNDRFRSGQGQSSGSKWGRGYLRSDESIEEDAWNVLRKNLKVDIGDIEVVVNDGIIKLHGSVLRLSDKREVESSVEQVPGVIDIHNELRVRRFY